MNARIRYIILWRDPRMTGAIFSSLFLVFVSLVYYSVIEVVTCIAIPCLIITLAIRSVSAGKCFFFKKPMENPFQCWLAEEWEISGNRMDSFNKTVADAVNKIIISMKKKLLVEDIVDSIKGLLGLIVWYYIGTYLSGMTLIFIGFVGLFTIPKLCDVYRRELDMAYKRLDQKYTEIMPRLQERIPVLANYDPVQKKKSMKSKQTPASGAPETPPSTPTSPAPAPAFANEPKTTKEEKIE